MRDDFAVFIPTHGRPEKQLTLELLKKEGYDGKWYLVLDNEDETKGEYEKRYGTENIIVFDKTEWMEKVDSMDNFHEHRASVYARNFIFQAARERGIKNFLMVDDDSTAISYRYEKDGRLLTKHFNGKINKIFQYMVKFAEDSQAAAVSFGMVQYLMGGVNSSNLKKGLIRKSLNSFFCSVDRPIEFFGSICEDVAAYTTYGSRGRLFFSFIPITLQPVKTMTIESGMTEVYREKGEYIKFFYPIISSPSSVEIAYKNGNAYHKIKMDLCVPKIISEKYKKGV